MFQSIYTLQKINRSPESAAGIRRLERQKVLAEIAFRENTASNGTRNRPFRLGERGAFRAQGRLPATMRSGPDIGPVGPGRSKPRRPASRAGGLKDVLLTALRESEGVGFGSERFLESFTTASGEIDLAAVTRTSGANPTNGSGRESDTADLALLFKLQRRPKGAADVLDFLFEAEVTRRQRVETFRRVARNALIAGNFALAVQCSSLWAVGSETSEAGCCHAAALLMSGRVSAAERVLKRTLERFPGDPDAAFALAELLFLEQRQEDYLALRPIMTDPAAAPPSKPRASYRRHVTLAKMDAVAGAPVFAVDQLEQLSRFRLNHPGHLHVFDDGYAVCCLLAAEAMPSKASEWRAKALRATYNSLRFVLLLPVSPRTRARLARPLLDSNIYDAVRSISSPPLPKSERRAWDELWTAYSLMLRATGPLTAPKPGGGG